MTKPPIQLSGPYRRPSGYLSTALRLMAASAVVGWAFGVVWALFVSWRHCGI